MKGYKYSFLQVFLFLGIENTNYVISHPLSSIAATGDKNDNVSNYRSGDFKGNFEAFIGNVKRKEMPNLAELKYSKVSTSSGLSNIQSYEKGDDYNGQSSMHFEKVHSLSQSEMTEPLPTENLLNEARSKYVRRAKRSNQQLSNLITVTTVNGVEKVHEGNKIHVDPREIIRATAEAIGVTQSFLAERVQVWAVNGSRTQAWLTGLPGSGYCGMVTINI